MVIEIYTKLLELDVPWSAFGNIGWTKVTKLLSIVTKETIAEWVEKAAHMTTLSLEDAIKAAKAPKALDGGEVEVKSTSTKTFKLHNDQKELVNSALEKMKEEGNTAVDAVALEYICQNYMGAGIQFKGWDQALTYARKHSDDPALFYQTVVARLDELCPEIEASTSITLKETPATVN